MTASHVRTDLWRKIKELNIGILCIDWLSDDSEDTTVYKYLKGVNTKGEELDEINKRKTEDDYQETLSGTKIC